MHIFISCNVSKTSIPAAFTPILSSFAIEHYFNTLVSVVLIFIIFVSVAK